MSSRLSMDPPETPALAPAVYARGDVHGAPSRGGLRLAVPGWVVGIGPLLVGVVVTLPLVLLLINSFNVAPPAQAAIYGVQNWVDAFSDPGTVSSLWYTVALGVVRTALALPIAFTIAWLIARTDMPGRTAVELLCWTGIFLPTLPLTFGWILLLDPHFGLLNALLQRLPFVPGSVFNIYGFWGIVWVQLVSTSVYYMVVLLLPALRRMNAAFEEAAQSCGASQIDTLRRVTAPLLKPAILGVTLLSFVRSLESFEVELVIGPPARIYVYSTRIYYLFHEQPPQFGQATALGSVFLVVMLALAILYQRSLRGRSYVTVTGKSYSAALWRLRRWRWPATTLCFVYLLLVLSTPLVLLILGSFMQRYGFFNLASPFTLDHWQQLFADSGFLSSAANSLVIGAGAALLAMVVYSLIAYQLTRARTRVSGVTDLLMWVPWATPGILLSLGLLWLFVATPLRVLLYGTIFGLILAMAIKESPLSTLFFRTSLQQVGAEIEESARVNGASWPRTYWRIVTPLLAPTAVTVGLLTFLSSLRDVSIPVLLYTPESRPLSLLMLEYTLSGDMERAAAVGVLITAFVLATTIVARYIGFRVARDPV